MKTQHQQEESLREKVTHLFENKSLHCEQKWHHLTADTKGIILEIVSELLQSHNDKLVAEIEGLRRSMIVKEQYCQDCGSNIYEGCVCRGFNEALDQVVNIIKSK